MGFCWDDVSECFPTGKGWIAEDLVLVKFPMVHKPSSPCPPWSSLSRETTFPGGGKIFIPTDWMLLVAHSCLLFCLDQTLVRFLPPYSFLNFNLPQVWERAESSSWYLTNCTETLFSSGSTDHFPLLAQFPDTFLLIFITHTLVCIRRYEVFVVLLLRALQAEASQVTALLHMVHHCHLEPFLNAAAKIGSGCALETLT